MKTRRFGLMMALESKSRAQIQTDLLNAGCDPATARKVAYSGTLDEASARAEKLKRQALYTRDPKTGEPRPLRSILPLLWEYAESKGVPRRKIAAKLGDAMGFDPDYVRREYRKAVRSNAGPAVKKSV
jgi:hypothetical protein